MAYNPEEATEIPVLAAGIVKEGVIIKIEDGKIKDHIHEDGREKWKHSLETSAIKVIVECLHDEVTHQADEVFTYINGEGKTKFSERSKIGKFKAYYKALPVVGGKVQMKTNADGYFKFVIE